MTTSEQVGLAVSEPLPYTFIEFLLDETGSMTSCADATKAGFDEFVENQREQPGECYLTLSKFDTKSIRTPYENLRIASVPRLTFYPGASTNLFDCIGLRLTRVMEQPHSGKSLFVIMTDGGDNGSQTYTIETARSLIETAQESGIVVVYLGPSDQALDVGTRLGIPTGNIKSFSTSEMRETMDDLTVSTSAFRAGTSTATTFFS